MACHARAYSDGRYFYLILSVNEYIVYIFLHVGPLSVPQNPCYSAFEMIDKKLICSLPGRGKGK